MNPYGPTVRLLSTVLLSLWLPDVSNAADVFGHIYGTSANKVQVKCSDSSKRDSSSDGHYRVSDGHYRVSGLPSNALCRLSATAEKTESNAITVRTTTTTTRFNGKLNWVGSRLILQSR